MVEVSSWFIRGESWVSNCCKRDLAAGGVHCGRREKLPGWEHWEEVLNVKVKFSEWGLVYAPAGGTATPLPGTGEHVMNLKRESMVLEFQVLVEVSIITYQFFHGKAALDLTDPCSAPEHSGRDWKTKHYKSRQVKTKKYLTACSRSCAAAAICPLSLLSIIWKDGNLL